MNRDNVPRVASALLRTPERLAALGQWRIVTIHGEPLCVMHDSNTRQVHIIRRFDLRPTESARRIGAFGEPPPAQVFIFHLTTAIVVEESDRNRLLLASRIFDRTATLHQRETRAS